MFRRTRVVYTIVGVETFFVGAAFVGDYTVFDSRPSETVNTLPTATAAPVILVDAMFSVWGISPI